MATKNKGFTLVELSIVLVIIGLLIGGVLAAQSMITTAKIQAFVKQIQQFDIAVRNFETKYASLPGDTNFLANPGNKDGRIQGTTISNHATGHASWDGEIQYFWVHLNQTGFDTSKTYTATITGGGLRNVGTTINVPQSKLLDQVSIAPMYTILDNIAFGNAYSIGWYDVVPTAIGMHSFTAGSEFGLSPAIPLAVDVKMDDGIYNTGNMRLYDPSDGGYACGYNIATTNYKTCYYFIKMTPEG